MLPVFVKLALVGNIPHGGLKEEVHVSSVKHSSFRVVRNDRCAESTEFIDVLSKQQHLGVDAKCLCHALNFKVVFRLEPVNGTSQLLGENEDWGRNETHILVEDLNDSILIECRHLFEALLFS